MVKSTGLLHAFRHPLVLISILVLLLNDHVFKASMPSALTGKLSDLAGLFFFPFLVGTILQGLVKLFLPARRLPARQALATSFFLSTAFFIGIKTFPSFNEFVAGWLSALFHLPVRIVLDPTDLLAFAVFIPAWMLWAHIERDRRPAAPGKLAFAVLGLGALACVATSPCMPAPSIQRLVAINDTLYARMDADNLAGFLSRDAGNNWEAVQLIPANIFSDLAGSPALPLTLCDPGDMLICFRISGQPWVEGSQDGGTSWQNVWQIPPERVSYLQRAVRRGVISCGKDPNITPLDMTFVIRGESSSLVVAMGNEGIVIHQPSGGWQRVTVSTSIYPTPIAARNLDEAFTDVNGEVIFGLVGAGLIYLGLSIWAWIFVARHASPTANLKPDWVFQPARFAAVWILLLVALPIINGIAQHLLLNFINFVWLFTAVTFPISILLISFLIWMRAGSLTARPGKYRLNILLSLATGLGICAIFIGCFLMWALDVIASYESALVIAAAVSVSILIVVISRMWRGMKLALTGPEAIESQQIST